MASVGEEAAQARADADLALTQEARVALALRLGHEDLVAYAVANGLTMKEAARRLRRLANAGRAPSGVMEALNR